MQTCASNFTQHINTKMWRAATTTRAPDTLIITQRKKRGKYKNQHSTVQYYTVFLYMGRSVTPSLCACPRNKSLDLKHHLINHIKEIDAACNRAWVPVRQQQTQHLVYLRVARRV